MRLNLELSEHTHHELKLRAAEEEVSMSALLRRAIEALRGQGAPAAQPSAVSAPAQPPTHAAPTPGAEAAPATALVKPCPKCGANVPCPAFHGAPHVDVSCPSCNVGLSWTAPPSAPAS